MLNDPTYLTCHIHLHVYLSAFGNLSASLHGEMRQRKKYSSPDDIMADIHHVRGTHTSTRQPTRWGCHIPSHAVVVVVLSDLFGGVLYLSIMSGVIWLPDN